MSRPYEASETAKPPSRPHQVLNEGLSRSLPARLEQRSILDRPRPCKRRCEKAGPNLDGPDDNPFFSGPSVNELDGKHLSALERSHHIHRRPVSEAYRRDTSPSSDLRFSRCRPRQSPPHDTSPSDSRTTPLEVPLMLPRHLRHRLTSCDKSATWTRQVDATAKTSQHSPLFTDVFAKQPRSSSNAKWYTHSPKQLTPRVIVSSHQTSTSARQ